MKKKSALSQLTVLCVEDDELALMVLTQILESRDARIITAENGAEGLVLYRQHRPDIVVSDIRMPVLDGLSMAKAIKEEDRDTPVIIITASDESESLIKAIDIGVDKYVLKPVEPAALVRAVEQCASDLSRRREIEVQNKHIQFILDVNPNFLVTVQECRIEYINRSFLNFLGHDVLDGFDSSLLTLDEIIRSIESESCPVGRAGLVEHLLARPEDDIVVTIEGYENSAKRARQFLVSFSRLPGSDRLLLCFTDVTGLREKERSLGLLATTDHLTGAWNRLRMSEILAAEINRARRHSSPLSLIFFDIDHFKLINDRYGHRAGDEVLRELAQLVQRNIRVEDTLARWGGEEFVILVPQLDRAQAETMSEKLRRRIEGHIFGPVGKLTCSFGVSTFTGESLEDFVHKADLAMYAAKRDGRNRVATAPVAVAPFF